MLHVMPVQRLVLGGGGLWLPHSTGWGRSVAPTYTCRPHGNNGPSQCSWWLFALLVVVVVGGPFSDFLLEAGVAILVLVDKTSCWEALQCLRVPSVHQLRQPPPPLQYLTHTNSNYMRFHV